MPHHPKVVDAGPLAFALDVAAICYSNRYELDGFIARSSLNAVLPGLKGAAKVAERLCSAGRWERDDDLGGWWIHDVLDYQYSAEQAGQRREKRAAAGRKGGRVSGAVRQAKSKQMLRESFGSDEPRPDPTRPDPVVSHADPVDKHTLSGGVAVDKPSGPVPDLVLDALDLEVERRLTARLDAGAEPGDLDLYRAGIRRRVFDDRLNDLARLHTERPDLDAAGLLHELDLDRYLS